jgi:hypothetical protein
MKTISTKVRTHSKSRVGRASRVETAALSGAVAGAAAGAIAGPGGILAGAAVGGAAGAIAGAALADEAEQRHAHERELDRDIGVTEGDLGAADPSQPPARVGAYSGASAGVGGSSGSTPSEGPIQDVDD